MRKAFYMVATDYNGQNISVKCQKQSDLDNLKETLPNFNWIECGPITYWLMKHSMTKLAMLRFWD